MIKNNNDNTNIQVVPVPSAFTVLQKIIKSKNSKEVQLQLPLLLEQRQQDISPMVSLVFKNHSSKAKDPLVREFTLKAVNYDVIFHKLLEIQDEETQEAIRLLYLYMTEKKSFNLDKIDGRELLELGCYKRIRKEHIDKVLRCIMRYLGMTITVIDPTTNIEKEYKKKNKIYTAYRHFTVLQVGHTYTEKDESDTSKEYACALINVKFMEGYMDFINNVSRSYLPLQTLVSIPKVSNKDKRRTFITAICELFSFNQTTTLTKTLEECMNIGEFFYARWKSEKARAWKPIEAALIEAKTLNLLHYTWITKSNEELEPCGRLEPKIFKDILVVKIQRSYNLNMQKK